MNKEVRVKELFARFPSYIAPLFEGVEYPGEVMPRIRGYLEALIKEGLSGYAPLSEGVLVGEGVRIYPTATLEPPLLIGAGTEIRPGAFLRGCVITGEGCVIGNSSELKNAVLFDNVQVPHYNYIGDSILGTGAHTGAGTICSNLKTDGRPVVVHGEREYETGLRKLGGILGDGADVGCGAVLNPGTVIGRNTSVYPLTSLRGVYPPGCIVKDAKTVVQKR